MKIPNHIAEQPFSDDLKPKQEGILCVYYQSINGFICMEDMYKYMTQMEKYKLDIFGWMETNINWTPNMKNKVKQMGRKSGTTLR
eukprot:15197878-Ditylum_brightwellii.AAC.1